MFTVWIFVKLPRKQVQPIKNREGKAKSAVRAAIPIHFDFRGGSRKYVTHSRSHPPPRRRARLPDSGKRANARQAQLGRDTPRSSG